MKKVTGIGGIFFRTKDIDAMKAWYSKNLGIESTQYGTIFGWREKDEPEKEGMTVWSMFSEKSKKFDPSEKPFMFNYRVENLPELLKELKAAGVEQIGEMEEYEYGKFAWIMDPEGNKIELWQP